MNELITVNRTDKGLTVDARELHEFLEVKDDFSTWIKRRIEKYGFIAGTDFSANPGKSTGGRPSIEYELTMTMAKELCMVENNEKGQQARRYFIDCEEQLKEMYKPQLQSPVEEKIRGHFLVADLIATGTGVQKGIAYACACTAIQTETGLDMSHHMKLLPAAQHETGHLIAGDVGERCGMNARQVNKLLLEAGLQYQEEYKKGKKQWRLTEAGAEFGEEFPYNRNGHSGYQIKWTDKIVEKIKQLAQ